MAKQMKYFFCLNTLNNESTYILAFDKYHAKARAVAFFNATDSKTIKVIKAK